MVQTKALRLWIVGIYLSANQTGLLPHHWYGRKGQFNREVQSSQHLSHVLEIPAFAKQSSDGGVTTISVKLAWKKVTRRFRGRTHTEPWWAAEPKFLGCGPERMARAIVATTGPRMRPAISTWYLGTNMTVADALLAEVVRLCGLRNWIEDHYKPVKEELGWAALRGALGPGDPPSRDAGQLRVLKLAGGMRRRKPRSGSCCGTAFACPRNFCLASR